MASGCVSVQAIRATCTDLAALALALSAEGSVALIVASDGGLSFTSSAAQAISEAAPLHPLHRMVVRACERLQERTGQDCAAAVAQLADLLRLAGDGEQRRAQLLRDFPAFEALLPEAFRCARDAVGTVAVDPERRLADVARTRSEAVSEVACAFLRSSVNEDWRAACEALDYFVDRCEDVCSWDPSGGESTVLKGYLFRADVPFGDDLRFVIVRDMSVTARDIVWAGDPPSGLRSAAESTLVAWKDLGVSAIFTPGAAPSWVRACCSRLGICLVDRVSEGDLRNISFFSGISPLDSLSDPVEGVSPSHSARPLVLCGARYLHLSPAGPASRFLPCHAVLRVPSACAWRQCRAEFRDCLRVLRQYLSAPISVPPGLWELELGRSLPSAPCPALSRVVQGALGAAALRECAVKRGFDPVVPAANAESALLQVPQLLRQLLRIDAVLPAKVFQSQTQTDLSDDE